MTCSPDTVTSNNLFYVNKDLGFTQQFLKANLTDIATLLFFAKLYSLDYHQVNTLFNLVMPEHELWNELSNGVHSTELQDYVADVLDVQNLTYVQGTGEQAAQEDVLTELFKLREVTIASSIREVADTIGAALGSLPSKEGHMVFSAMRRMNLKRNTIGDYRAQIQRKHKTTERVLVILDDSGSMSKETIQTIAEDVVALSYSVDATLVQVSNTARVHTPGTFNVHDVLSCAEYKGTDYSQLLPLFQDDWDVVVCIADYDSYGNVKALFRSVPGHVGKVIDISLVHKSTWLGECVAGIADEYVPMLISKTSMSF